MYGSINYTKTVVRFVCFVFSCWLTIINATPDSFVFVSQPVSQQNIHRTATQHTEHEHKRHPEHTHTKRTNSHLIAFEHIGDKREPQPTLAPNPPRNMRIRNAAGEFKICACTAAVIVQCHVVDDAHNPHSCVHILCCFTCAALEYSMQSETFWRRTQHTHILTHITIIFRNIRWVSGIAPVLHSVE